ncbi:sodium/potassium-transporting ATPase subunit beta-2-like [Sinocyclocheilus anshuiensis]|uniref:sodium/potassium-transporting ATPase subunit beta-2-like n=1 Tax=Sinocyclocheilus anshuiensis TaxID=1608454 RepID=UPI0007B89282|nr:PREDICTED: sodium/potassium-transporting ATPase subunit beta-2-like [Sinocyclocheilus anshuiensis]
MMIQPKTDLLEIVYNVEKTENWDSYVQALDNFLAPYNDSQQVMKNDACVPDQYFTQEDSGEVRNNPKRSCQFNRTVLEECSGLSDHTYGYQDGKPCVLIKLNRVTGQSQNGRAHLMIIIILHIIVVVCDDSRMYWMFTAAIY